MGRLSRVRKVLGLLILASGLNACAESGGGQTPAAAQSAPSRPGTMPAPGGMASMAKAHGPSDSLPAAAFRGMVEVVAKEIASAPAYQDNANAPTIALGDFHNGTALRLDRAMVLESVRAETILVSGGKVKFRDDAAYGAIVEERARQAATAAAVERSGWRPAAASHFEQRTSVDGRVAEARVILAGAVFQLHDRDASRADWGTTHHQFHFRLIDVRTGLVLWEKVVSVATEGAIVAPKDNVADEARDGRRRAGGGFTGRLAR